MAKKCTNWYCNLRNILFRYYEKNSGKNSVYEISGREIEYIYGAYQNPYRDYGGDEMERFYFLEIMDRKGNKQEIEIQELEFKPKKTYRIVQDSLGKIPFYDEGKRKIKY